MVLSHTPATPPSDASSDGRETPHFFESAGRPLYGVFHEVRAVRAAAPVVVFCPSLGVEPLTNYRNEVRMARALASAGFAALRYHPRGHGDSTGDFADVTLAGLIEDACVAADHARARSGATRVVWLATRFGALVAAGALAARDDSAALALWEPVHRPLDYFRGQLRGMLFSRVAHGERPDATVDQLLERLEREGQVDVHGYYLHRALYASAREADLARALAGWRGPTLIAQVQGRPRLAPLHLALANALESGGSTVTTLTVKEEPGWHFISNPAWESDTLLHRTAEWLRGLA